MKVQYASDLHLEMLDNGRFIHNGGGLDAVGDVLVLAGDIGYFDGDGYTGEEFWEELTFNYQRVLVVPGNHEFYYGADLGRIYPGRMVELAENITMHYNDVVRIGDVEFILCPLWAHVPPENAFETQRRVSDFHKIRYDGELLTPERFNEEHRCAVEFLKNALATSTAAKRVVVTHHVPTALCMSPEFKGSPINGAFVAELHDLIHDSNIDYWIYGHSHRNMLPVEIGGTRLVTNQLGYVRCERGKEIWDSYRFTHETGGYSPAAFFEI